MSASEETIFTNGQMAHQCRADLLRLVEATVQPGPADIASAADRWAAYLEESRGTRLSPRERVLWARWIGRLVAAATGQDAGQLSPPLASRALVTRIMVQLLARGVWESGDQSWREPLARLAADLVPRPAGDEPGPVRQLAAALAAVCVALLRNGVSMTAGTQEGILAARAWRKLRPLVADADPDLVADLLMSPVHVHAVTLNLSELEETILLAMDDDPAALLTAELEERGWHLSDDGLMYRVTGAFTNPVNVAAQVATELGRSLGTVLVHAQAGSRWAFIAWRRPDLLLASEPGHAWRLYRIDGAVTPQSRFTAADGVPAAGLVGRPVPFGKGLPPAALDLLGAAGADPADVLTRIISATGRSG